MKQLIRTLYLCIMCAVLASCTIDNHSRQQQLDDAKALWQKSNTGYYQVDFAKACFCLDLPKVRASIYDGDIISAIAIDGSAIEEQQKAMVINIESAFDYIQTAIDNDAQKLDVTYSKENGAPLSIYVDMSSATADDEYSLVYTNLTIAPRSHVLAGVDTWSAIYFDSFGGPIHVLPTIDLELSFDLKDNLFTATSPCYDFEGAVSVNESALSFSNVQTTSKECATEQELVAQNEMFADIFANTHDYHLNKDHLSISAGADIGVQFIPDYKKVIELVDIASYRQTCSELSYKLCLQIKKPNETDFEPLYEEITGYQHQWGQSAQVYMRTEPVSYDTYSVEWTPMYVYHLETVSTEMDAAGTEYLDPSFHLDSSTITQSQTEGVYQLSDGTLFDCTEGVNCQALTELHQSVNMIEVRWRLSDNPDIPLTLAEWN
jgi:hypothetical protein